MRLSHDLQLDKFCKSSRRDKLNIVGLCFIVCRPYILRVLSLN